MTKGFFTVLLLMSMAGCSTLSRQQTEDYKAWESDGRLIQEKNTKKAFWLGVLPGGGAFYTRQYFAGIADILLWPFSVAWDPVIAVGAARRINFEATRYAMETGRMPKYAAPPPAEPQAPKPEPR